MLFDVTSKRIAMFGLARTSGLLVLSNEGCGKLNVVCERSDSVSPRSRSPLDDSRISALTELVLKSNRVVRIARNDIIVEERSKIAC